MATKDRPTIIELTEISNNGTDAREFGISVTVAQIRKLITENVTLWVKGSPRQAKVTIIEHLDRDTTMVKESVRHITKLMNGDVVAD